jgi:RHS repeat-associated protein
MADWHTDDVPRRRPPLGPASSDKAPASDPPAPRVGSGTGPATPPVPSLPKGGGSIRGIGEKFSANPVTGTASLQVPLAVSPGRAGFQPDLSLTYNSGAGNGPFGHGFQLSVPHITRKTDKGIPRYDDANDSDVFILAGAEDLVPRRLEQLGWQKERFDDGPDLVERYVPRLEGQFARIEKREHKTTGDVYWQATTRDNVTTTYGRSDAARIAHPAQPRLVFTWLLEETRDDRGNVCVYQYKAEDLVQVPRTAACEKPRLAGDAPIANRYLKRIRYGNTVPFDATPGLDSALFELVLDYGEHDVETPTVDEARPWPCRQDPFSTYRAGFEIRTYRLCRRALMFHRMAELGATPCLVRSTDLAYAENPVLTQLVAVRHTGYLRDPDALTYTRKSHPAVEFGYALPQIQTDIQVLEPASTADLPEGVRDPYQWVDLDGEGLPGVLSQHGGGLYYKQNVGRGELLPARILLRQPSLVQLGDGGQQIADLDGDGRKELAIFTAPTAGYFDRTEDGSFEPFQLFPAQLQIDWNDPDLRHIDLNGDGLDDVLLARADSFTWYPSLAKGGFGAGITLRNPSNDDRGPALVFADGTQTLFVADMSGDGLGDLVRIQNGSVCYWPNLGHGQFGAKVQMGGELHFDFPERFDPRRIRLADVDGSGTTDVLYFQPDGVRIYTNQAGNTFAPPIKLPCFPDTSELSSFTAIDLLGTGTGCLVWSSALPGQEFRTFRYIDLLGSQKPYLLTSYRNNLGLETRLEYAPSTRFYLADAAAGRPWVTRLHFPVHVLARIETYDAISRHRFVSTYAYHHGYFDGVEREFRGFGMVEQWDTESFSRFSGVGELPPPANATDPEMHLPPVHTRTWFHTGAWLASDQIARQYAHEYYAGDAQAVLLPDTTLPSGLGTDDIREACRALKGQILRQETYADDGSPQAPHPYLVSERSYDVRCLQPASREAHGVFFVHPREAIEYHYERNPSDPRISHALTLEVDAYGTVRRSAAIGYPRRAAHAILDEQRRLAITLTESDVLHHGPVAAPGWYRLGVPLAARSYELTGVVIASEAPLPFTAVLAAADAATAIPYEAIPDGSIQKRLLSETRSLYARDDLSGPLPFGAVESRALPWQGYAKAFTPALVADVFQGRVTDAILIEGGYCQLTGEDAWWIPSGRQVPAVEAFYQPVAFLDAFGNITTTAYDAYHLLVTQVVDPVHNTVTAAHDYRILAPAQVTDANGNRAQARCDALGMVVATAVLGKPGSSDGDTLDDPTVAFDYDLDRYRLTGKPGVVHTRAREQHGADTTRWQDSYSYTSGSGREVMKKVQAEPGPAPQRDPSGALVHDAQGKLVMADTSARWVGTGRTVFDNKGNPVKQYEPFFSSTFEYEDEAELVEWGVTPILHYDPLGRLIRTDLPDGTFRRVVFDPWQETHFDPNDTVLDSAWYQDRKALDPNTDPQGRAAALAAAHANTPGITHLDALGRAVRTIEDNGPAGQYTTTTALDIEGNPLTVTDARDIVAMRHRFGMERQKLWQNSCDAGERWMLTDAGGEMLRGWDGRGFTRRAVYDVARRVTHRHVQPAGGAEFLTERIVYGEALGDQAAASNHRGKAYQHFDGAGVVTCAGYDFKGNLLTSERRMAREYRSQVDWSAIAGVAVPDVAASPLAELLEAEAFTSHTAYDAFGRPTSLTTPDSSETLPVYNAASLLDRILVRLRGAPDATTFVDAIDYDAKGQRQKIVYGGENGKRTTTTYSYDPMTFRLASLTTQRESDGALLQSLTYAYDPVGNITAIADAAQQTVFFDNAVVTPSTSYVYDAIYRLIQATGRELAGGLADSQRDHDDMPMMPLPHPNDLQAVRRYSETYNYDAVGNFLQMAHVAGGTGQAGSWTRRYAYDTAGGLPASNRLIATSLPGDADDAFSAKYTYDAHGNMTSMPHLASIGWNDRDQMTSADRGGGGTVYFTYDASGQRVRKVYEHGGLVEERIYLGSWEVYRKRQASSADVALERETLHVMDAKQRIALVETKTIDIDVTPFDVTTRWRTQLGNHLGSSTLELDQHGSPITYEEYHPYGTTAFRASTAETSSKRYRYTGKERDDESGLGYHSARYYASWLGRWTSCDPARTGAEVNLFAYVRCNPARYIDHNGLWETDMHFLGAYWAGRMQGATHVQAMIAALGSQSLDDSIKTKAPNLKATGGREIDAWNVLTVRGGSLAEVRFANNAHSLGVTKSDSQAVALKGISEQNLLLFGLGLHAAGDYLPHANLSGIDTPGHQVGYNEDFSLSDGFSHEADKTRKNPRKALATFETLRELWSQYLHKPAPSKLKIGERSLNDFSEFVFADSLADKHAAFSKGMKNLGISDSDISDALDYFWHPDKRINALKTMRDTPKGGDAFAIAKNMWFGKPNDDIFNATQIDIWKEIGSTPHLGTTEFETRRSNNLANAMLRYWLNPLGTLAPRQEVYSPK